MFSYSWKYFLGSEYESHTESHGYKRHRLETYYIIHSAFTPFCLLFPQCLSLTASPSWPHCRLLTVMLFSFLYDSITNFKWSLVLSLSWRTFHNFLHLFIACVRIHAWNLEDVVQFFCVVRLGATAFIWTALAGLCKVRANFLPVSTDYTLYTIISSLFPLYNPFFWTFFSLLSCHPQVCVCVCVDNKCSSLGSMKIFYMILDLDLIYFSNLFCFIISIN